MHASNHQQNDPHTGDGNFAKIDDLEGRLRGMILKNNPSTADNPPQGSQSGDPSASLTTKSVNSVARDSEEASNSAKQRRKPRKAKARLPIASIEDPTAVAKSPIQDGQDLDKRHEAPQGRGRRPNQAQRRQKGKVELQGPLSTPTADVHQPNSQAIPPQIHRTSQPQISGTPQVNINPMARQLPELQHRPALQHQQYGANQPQQHSHPPSQMPQHHQNQYQHASHARGLIKHAGHRFGPAPEHAILAPPNMRSVHIKVKIQFPILESLSDFVDSNMHQSRAPRNMTYNSPSTANQYARPLAPNRQLYQGHMATSSHYHRPHFSHPETAAQNAFVHAVSEAIYDKARASSEELQEKEELRLHLQRICTEAVSKFEKAKNPQFDAGSVALACFGSLRSGFATCGSDMDLALVSPASFPDLASAESAIPRLLEKVLLDLGYGARLLTKTRVPIIRFCETPTAALLEALRENRAKWEREKDAPPKSKLVKTAQSKNEGMVISGENGEKTATSTTPSIKDDNSSQIAISELTASGKAHNDQKTLKSLKGDEAPPLQANDTKSSITSRTDEELVRLYKLAIKEGWFEPSERLVIVKFIEAVKLHGADGDHKALVELRLQLQNLPDVLSRYRVPPESHLDYPKTGVGVQCDINFSNHLALHNTCLLKCYSLCDPRVQPMIVVVKAWAKSRKINSSYHGTLSSYGYVLMALHYLMNVAQLPIIPNLQVVPQASVPENGYGLNGYEVRFWRSEHEITEAARRGQLTQNRTDTIGSLLRGFFQYYAHPYGGFSWATDVLSLRTPGGLLRKEDKGWTGARTVTVESTVPGEDAKEVRHRYLFAIEDPFELDHNVARTVVHNGIVAIRDEFRRADRIIQSHGAGKPMADYDLFAEAATKENLQRKFFGPLIKPVREGTHQKIEGVSKETTAETQINSKLGKEKIASGKQQGGRHVRTADRSILRSEKPSSSVKEELRQTNERQK